MLRVSVLLLVLVAVFQPSLLDELEDSIYWPLPNGLPVGTTITVVGKTGSENDSKRAFEIDLKESLSCAQGIWKADTMFHISVRYVEGVVVLNNYVDGQYKNEQYHNISIKPHSLFNIKTTLLEDKFQVLIDSKDTFYFEYRVPYTDIKSLIVRGNVNVTEITFSH